MDAKKHMLLSLSMIGSLFAQGPVDEPFFLPDESPQPDRSSNRSI